MAFIPGKGGLQIGRRTPAFGVRPRYERVKGKHSYV